MTRLREAWHNDVLLSMASAFCVGLGLGLFTLAFALAGPWAIIPFGVCLALFSASTSLLGRAERLRAARWKRGDWR